MNCKHCQRANEEIILAGNKAGQHANLDSLCSLDQKQGKKLMRRLTSHLRDSDDRVRFALGYWMGVARRLMHERTQKSNPERVEEAKQFLDGVSWSFLDEIFPKEEAHHVSGS